MNQSWQCGGCKTWYAPDVKGCKCQFVQPYIPFQPSPGWYVQPFSPYTPIQPPYKIWCGNGTTVTAGSTNGRIPGLGRGTMVVSDDFDDSIL